MIDPRFTDPEFYQLADDDEPCPRIFPLLWGVTALFWLGAVLWLANALIDGKETTWIPGF